MFIFCIFNLWFEDYQIVYVVRVTFVAIEILPFWVQQVYSQTYVPAKILRM